MEFRFRIDAEPGHDPVRPRWRARLSHRRGYSEFRIAVDFDASTCSFDEQHFEFELVGAKMSRRLGDYDRSGADPIAPFQREPPGRWIVLRVRVPGGRSSFLLGLGTGQGRGMVVLHRPKRAPEAVKAVARILREAISTSSANGDTGPAGGSRARRGEGLPDLDDGFEIIEEDEEP